MAKTFAEIKAGAITIKDNAIPESNTSPLVGGEMLNIVEKMEDMDSKTVTSDKLDFKVDKELGKGLSTNDFTDLFKAKLETNTSLSDAEINGSVSTLNGLISGLQNQLDTLTNGNTTAVLDTFREIETFLAGFTKMDSLTSILFAQRNEILLEVYKHCNEINVDVLYPIASGTFYNLTTALTAIESKYKRLGASIQFATSLGVTSRFGYKMSTLTGWATTNNWELIETVGLYGNYDIVNNLNTVDHSGFFTFYGTATGSPFTGSGFLQHQNSGVGTLYEFQRATSYIDGHTVERFKNNGTFGTWISMAKTTFNATVEAPLATGLYHTLTSAITASPVKGLNNEINFLFATYEVDVLTVTSGAHADGNIVITLNGVAFIVTILATDNTAALVATKLRAATYSGWTVSGTAANIVFTSNAIGAKAAPFISTNTGAVANISRTTVGKNEKWLKYSFSSNDITKWADTTKWILIKDGEDISTYTTKLSDLATKVSALLARTKGLVDDGKSAEFRISDSEGNVILKIDNSGVHSFNTNGFHGGFKKDQFIVTDAFGNQVLRVGEDGYVYAMGFKTVSGAGTLDIIAPKFLFQVDNASSPFAREYVNRLYPEGFINVKSDLKINGSRKYPFRKSAKNSTNVEIETKALTLETEGYSPISISVDIVSTKSSIAKGHIVKTLYLGNSLTANFLPENGGAGGGNVASLVMQQAIMDNADYGTNDIRIISTGINKDEVSFTYNGTTYSYRAGKEGAGGWTTADFLRHGYGYIMKQNDAGSTATWNLYGLATKGGTVADRPWTGSADQKREFRDTCFGVYPCEYNATVYSWLGGTGTYTGSTAQKAVIDTFVNKVKSGCRWLGNYPVGGNPFYDYDTVVASSGNHAFSLSKYISKFKTLADDGVTRLTYGVDAGSVYSDQSSINAYNVCASITHVAIELGANNFFVYPTEDADVVATKNDLLTFMSVIQAEYPTMKVALYSHRKTGYFRPDLCPDSVVSPLTLLPTENAPFFSLNKMLINELGTLSSQSAANRYYIPTYFVQDPSSCAIERIANDAAGNKVKICGTDPVHPAYDTYSEWAQQVLGWIYYTLSL